RWIGSALAVGTLVALVVASGVLVQRRDSQPDYLGMRRCAQAFVPYVPQTGTLVVNGGTMTDEYGRPVAYNESMLFACMARRGLNDGREELSIDPLERIKARGGRYWIVRHDELGRGDLERAARVRYRRLADCEFGYALYDLAAAPS